MKPRRNNSRSQVCARPAATIFLRGATRTALRVLASSLFALTLVLLGAPGACAAEPSEIVRTPTCTERNLAAVEALLIPALTRHLSGRPGPRAAEAAAYYASRPRARLVVGFPSEQKALYPGRPKSEGQEMRFEGVSPEFEPVFVLPHFVLHRDGADEALLASSPARLRAFAPSLAGIFVHEAQHAVNRRRLLAGGGGPTVPQFVEDELVAWYAQHLYLLKQLDADPGYDRLRETIPVAAAWAVRYGARRDAEAEAVLAANPRATKGRRDNVFMLALLARSNAEFEAKVRDSYRQRPSLDDPAALAAHLSALKETAAKLTRARANEDALSRHPLADAPTRAKALRVRADLDDALLDVRSAISFLDSPERMAAARAYYRERLAALRAEADALRARPAGPLSAFSPRRR